jgi:hypothetical protein
MSASYVTISNSSSLSSSVTGVNPGTTSREDHLSDKLDVRKPLMVAISQRSEELKLYNLL